MSRPDDESGAGGFLGRWARRKQESKRAPAPDAPPLVEGQAATSADPAAADLPLPSLDSIIPGADVSAFFQGHVPEALRNAALRKLWTTDPEISGFIEMADYQWDFNNPDSIPGWGSTLPQTDITRLANRLLGVAEEAPDQRHQPTELAAETASPQICEDVPSASPRAPQGSEAMPAADDDADSADVAPQKIVDETVIYSTARKRHGGALPS